MQKNPKVMTAAHVAGFWPFTPSAESSKPGVLEAVGETATTISTGIKFALILGGALAVYVVYKTVKNVTEQSREVVKVLPVMLAPEAQATGMLTERVSKLIER